MSRYCPFLVAAKWHRENPRYEDFDPRKCECLEKRCAVWNEDSHRCGLVSNLITRKAGVDS